MVEEGYGFGEGALEGLDAAMDVLGDRDAIIEGMMGVGGDAGIVASLKREIANEALDKAGARLAEARAAAAGGLA